MAHVNTLIRHPHGEVESLGQLWRILQAHVDAQLYPVSSRDLARALKVSPTTIGNWRSGRAFPSKENLVAIARLTGTSYSDVLEAALMDSGYREVESDAQHATATKVGVPGELPGTPHEWDVARSALLAVGLTEASVVEAIGARPVDREGGGTGSSRRRVRGA